MLTPDPKDTPARKLVTTAAPKHKAEDDETQAAPDETPERPSQPMSISDTPPPPYTPGQCTCPRHLGTLEGGSQTRADPPNPEGEGPNWKKVVGGTVAVAVAAPILVTAGAAIALPAIGFASTGVVGGSIAAGIQSLFYGAATGGLFSVFQSVGATIVAPSLLSTATAASAAAAGGALIGGEIQKSDGGGEEGSSASGSGQVAAHVQCSCMACVCDESCQCVCRRGRRKDRA